MKKFLNLIFLLGCFSLCIATSAEAQTQATPRVVNNTDCEMFVEIEYGLGCDAAMTNTTNLLVGPGETVLVVAIPPGEHILNAKGYYSLIGGPGKCDFHVGLIDCGMYNPSNTVTCGPPCGNYTATLIQGFGVVLNN